MKRRKRRKRIFYKFVHKRPHNMKTPVIFSNPLKGLMLRLLIRRWNRPAVYNSLPPPPAALSLSLVYKGIDLSARTFRLRIEGLFDA